MARRTAVFFAIVAALAAAGCTSPGEVDSTRPVSHVSPVVSDGPSPLAGSLTAQATPLDANASKQHLPVPTIGPSESTGATVLAKTSTTGNESDITNASVDAESFDLFSGRSGSSVAYVGADTASVEDVLERGLRLAETSPVHIAIRGTASASSVRCGWRGIARTPSQRERAVRFWLRLDEADEIPDASFLETMFTATMDTLNPYFRETAKSNFNAIARGGLSNEYMFLTCHARRPVLLQEQASRRRRGQEIPG